MVGDAGGVYRKFFVTQTFSFNSALFKFLNSDTTKISRI